MIYDTSADTIQSKVLDGERITPAEAVRALSRLDAPRVGRAGGRGARAGNTPGAPASPTSLTRNINYTNGLRRVLHFLRLHA